MVVCLLSTMAYLFIRLYVSFLLRLCDCVIVYVIHKLIYMHTHTHTHTHTRARAYTHTYMCARSHTHIYTHKYMYTDICIYTHTRMYLLTLLGAFVSSAYRRFPVGVTYLSPKKGRLAGSQRIISGPDTCTSN